MSWVANVTVFKRSVGPTDASARAARAPHNFGPLSVAAQMAVAELKARAARVDELQAEMAERIVDARACGLSWDQIGWSLGMAGEAARRRWGFEPASR